MRTLDGIEQGRQSREQGRWRKVPRKERESKGDGLRSAEPLRHFPCCIV